jgi:acetoin:2,6-dichlorophenolindophenol oxidoreductase subunit beta
MRNITFTQIIRETLEAEMQRDQTVLLMGEDIGIYGGAFGVTRGLIEIFGEERVRDTPITEQAITGIAIGAAVSGQRPIIEIMFMDFITLAADQLINMAAKLHPIYGQPCPLVLRTPPGAGRGYGATHSQSLERIFFGVPGIKIVAPSDAEDASALLQGAIRDNNPVIFLEHKLLYPMRFQVGDTLPEPSELGKAKIARRGEDITIIAWSYMTVLALRAAEQLAQEDIQVEVVDLRTLAPLDTETVLTSVKATGRVLIVEEAPLTGGIAAEIAARINEAAFEYLDYPVKRHAGADLPVPSAKNLESACMPSLESIIQAAADLAMAE